MATMTGSSDAGKRYSQAQRRLVGMNNAKKRGLNMGDWSMEALGTPF